MSLINVTHVEVLDNPTKFTNPFQFEITFECLAPGVQEELEWKLVYVGSAEDEKYDQELDSVLVGPVVVGKNKFVFQAPAPDPSLIPAKDVMEVTVLLLTASYKDKEFIRIGYYVNNDYPDSEVELVAGRDAWMKTCAEMQKTWTETCAAIKAQEEGLTAAATAAAAASGAPAPAPVLLPIPPQPTLPLAPPVDISKLNRNILADKPRVTRFQVTWDQPQGSAEFLVDAADEAKAASYELAEAAAQQAADAAVAAGTPLAAEEEEEEDEDEDDDMEGDEGEEEEEGAAENEEVDAEEDEAKTSTGPQGMSVE